METNLIVIMAAWFIGGLVSGVSGIGGAMIAVPIAAMFIPIHDVIVLSCMLNLAMDAVLAVTYISHCRIKSMWPLFAGAFPGSVAGLYVLQMVPGSWLQGGVGCILLIFLYWKQRFVLVGKRRESWQLGCVAGFSSGVLGTSISFDGPPMGAYGLYAGWEPRVYLGTLGVFFIFRGLFTCVLQAYADFYTSQVIHYALYGFPATVLGTMCAYPVVKRVDNKVFTRVLSGVILAAALMCIYKAFF